MCDIFITRSSLLLALNNPSGISSVYSYSRFCDFLWVPPVSNPSAITSKVIFCDRFNKDNWSVRVLSQTIWLFLTNGKMNNLYYTNWWRRQKYKRWQYLTFTSWKRRGWFILMCLYVWNGSIFRILEGFKD